MKTLLKGKNADIRVFVEYNQKTHKALSEYLETRAYQVYGVDSPFPSLMISFPKEKAFPPIL